MARKLSGTRATSADVGKYGSKSMKPKKSSATPKGRATGQNNKSTSN